MAYPVSRRLTRMSGSFGPRKPIQLSNGKWSPSFHGGVDFTPLERGTPLPTYSVGRGKVIIADRTAERGDSSGRDIGIRLDGDGSIWWYGHLSRVDVNVGDRVADGQQIGLIGATGNVTGVHLHLERHWPRLNVETDPWPYIKDARDIDGLTSSWQTGNPPVAEGDSGKTPPVKTPAQIEEEELMAAKDDIIKGLKAEIAQAMEVIRRESRPRLYERASTGELLLVRYETGFQRGPWPNEKAMRAALPVEAEHLVSDQEYKRRLKVSDEDWSQLVSSK